MDKDLEIYILSRNEFYEIIPHTATKYLEDIVKIFLVNIERLQKYLETYQH